MKKIALTLSFLMIFCAFVVNLSACSNNKENITEYQIECSLQDNILSGKQTVTFYNDTELAFNELKFNLFANAFRENAKFTPISSQHTYKAYPNGLDYGNIQIQKVSIDDKDVDFSIGGVDQNILIVPLETEVFPNERVSVYIEYTLKLANVIARTGYNSNTINLANFYPILCGIDEHGFYECVYYSTGDPFYSDVASYSVTFSCDQKYVVASSGHQQSRQVKDGVSTSVYYLSCARDFTLVLSQDFCVETDLSTGVEINYYYYDDKEPKTSLKFAVQAINLFSQKFGEYPYQTLAVVQTQFVQGGMEFPALVMISDDLEGQSYGEVIVHETAHQWWQSAVGNNEVEFGFLDEGLAEYSVVMFYENYPEYSFTRQDLIKSSENTYKVFCSVYDKVFHSVNTVMIRSLKDFTSEYEYVNIAYIKPCIMFDSLRTTIGEERFFNSLKRYYKEYKFKNATPDHLVGAFEKCGADANGFFESFFSGKVIL
ncbi:MAG: M1 family metallopeptidase [Clostridiales bacterium]|nr:M1 family metallopeptidase [Clostridiales bacterium]